MSRKRASLPCAYMAIEVRSCGDKIRRSSTICEPARPWMTCGGTGRIRTNSWGTAEGASP